LKKNFIIGILVVFETTAVQRAEEAGEWPVRTEKTSIMEGMSSSREKFG